MGSFRPAAGNQHLHWYCNFAGFPIETAPKSLLHSCRSELTRQGISLTFLLTLSRQSGLYLHPARESRAIQLIPGAQRIVSEDPPDVRPEVSCGLSNPKPFLLLVENTSNELVGWALRMFPHIAEFSSAHYCVVRQRYSCYLRTVIVTAAVYWGFRSKLRLR